MKNITKFTYPTFLGLAGFFSALGDIIQNQTVTIGVMIGLLLLGASCMVFPKSLTVDRIWCGWLHNEVGPDFTPRFFGATCLVLAAFMYGFSDLSARAADDGGIIASQYKKVQEIQLMLGIVERDLAEIKSTTREIKADTSQLLLAADQWIKFDLFLLHTSSHQKADGDWLRIPSGSSVLVDNATNFQFEDIRVVVTSPEDGEIYRHTYENLLEKQQRYEREVIGVAYENVGVCVSAKRRGQNEWLVDRHKMKIVYGPDHYSNGYQKYESDGVKILQSPTSCG
ncbi:hypothetical protein [Rhizobium laguerreae]|uniref:hypothetical protein n=1 Tax=Rhizobium laguerreae TaxID=1076926 RepID=UPI001C928B7B|nr:hypothetical protein [Rhizobium laguerreae]MBY3381690.1 hypothetical protein [Rhizobium laguerreae]